MVKGITTNQKLDLNDQAKKGSKNTTVLLSDKFLEILKEKDSDNKK